MVSFAIEMSAKTPGYGGLGGLRCGSSKRPTDGQAVGEARTAASRSSSTTEGRPSVDRQPFRSGRDSLGSEDRSPVARPSRRIPQPFDLLASPAAVGRTGCVASHLALVSRRARRQRPFELGGIVHRRQLLPGEKRGPEIGKTKRGKGTKCMVVVDGKGLPLGVFLASASPAEVTLVHPTLATIAVPRSGPGRPKSKPGRLIGDKAYDSEALRDALAHRGIELIAPHRSNRVRAARQDGRPLRRYKRRWIVERTFAWYGSFRRLVVRYERSSRLYLAFFHLASALIVMRRL